MDTHARFRGGATLRLVVAAAAGAAMLVPGAAHAQFAERLYLHAEGGVGTFLGKPQSDTFGLGFNVAGRLGVRIVGPVGVHVFGGYWNWSASQSGGSSGTVTGFGGGLRIAPELSRSLGRIFLDLEAGDAITGAQSANRLMLSAGLGWAIPIGRVLDIGPVVRVGDVLPASNETADSPGGTGAAIFWTAGLLLGVHGPAEEEAAPAPPADTDHDGVLDTADQCPTVPQGDHPDPARPGCPAQDTDGDGVLDPDDQCPTQPMGDHPDPARRGCPAADTDGDGVFDPDDQCPTVPQGNNPDPARRGCPVADTDHDGVPDPADLCPTEPAGDHPDPTRPGCPMPRPTARVEAGRITINETIHFDTDRATIQDVSFPILTEVAQAMVQHPEILRVSIEGHTDNQGAARHNMTLSRNRARAVQQYLVDHGVDRRRLTARGFGATHPVQPGDTEAARAANRRVEFLIVGGSGRAEPGPGAATPGGTSADEPETTHGHHGHGGHGHHGGAGGGAGAGGVHHGGGHHGGAHHGH